MDQIILTKRLSSKFGLAILVVALFVNIYYPTPEFYRLLVFQLIFGGAAFLCAYNMVKTRLNCSLWNFVGYLSTLAIVCWIFYGFLQATAKHSYTLYIFHKPLLPYYAFVVVLTFVLPFCIFAFLNTLLLKYLCKADWNTALNMGVLLAILNAYSLFIRFPFVASYGI